MENVFIVRYRRALRELQEAYRLQYALVDESDALRTLAYQQAHTAEKAILKNRKSGRGFLISRLRECLDEKPYAWAVTQHIKREIEEMEANRYDSEISDEQNHALYLVIEDAICELLEVFGSQFPKVLTGSSIATYRGNVSVSELVLKFGPPHLQRIVRQRLKAAADNPASAVAIIEAPQPNSPPLDTPASQAIAKPSQPGSLAPNKGGPHLGDTLDTAPPAALTVADLCRDGFTPDDVLALAREVGLADEAGRFCLWSRKPGTKPRKLGAVVGFCKALGGDAKGLTAPLLAGTIPERVQAVGVLLDVEIRTTKTGTGVAEKYRKATERALAERKRTH